MTKIDMYTDGRYPRGMEIHYKVDGSQTYNYIYFDRSMTDAKKTLSAPLAYNEYVMRVDLWKVGSELQQVDIYIDSKNKLAGGQILTSNM